MYGSFPLILALHSAQSAAPAGLTFTGSTVLDDGRKINAWEDLHGPAHPMQFFLADNTTLVLSLDKRQVDSGQSLPAANQPCCAGGRFTLAQLKTTAADLVGKALLQSGVDGEPDEQQVASAIPPFTAQMGGVAAFVGSRKGPPYPLRRDGSPALAVGWNQPWKTPALMDRLNAEFPNL